MGWFEFGIIVLVIFAILLIPFIPAMLYSLFVVLWVSAVVVLAVPFTLVALFVVFVRAAAGWLGAGRARRAAPAKVQICTKPRDRDATP